MFRAWLPCPTRGEQRDSDDAVGQDHGRARMTNIVNTKHMSDEQIQDISERLVDLTHNLENKNNRKDLANVAESWFSRLADISVSRLDQNEGKAKHMNISNCEQCGADVVGGHSCLACAANS